MERATGRAKNNAQKRKSLLLLEPKKTVFRIRIQHKSKNCIKQKPLVPTNAVLERSRFSRNTRREGIYVEIRRFRDEFWRSFFAHIDRETRKTIFGDGLKHSRGRISNDAGWRKTQEEKDFQAEKGERPSASPLFKA